MALAPDIVEGVSRRLVEHAGLELPAWVVEARVASRVAATGVTPEAYLALITSGRGAGELAELIEAVRVGESSLFRHRQQIAALVDVVAPALRTRGKKAVRVWSAGCAAGEEPYTLAIVLSRALPGCQISVIATDVSADALAAAEQASYPRAVLADVPEDWRDAFVDDGDRLRVRPEIARLVRFERANLVDAVPPRACDVVWCRNVLIYFSADARRRVIERLVHATVPGGFVFVGYSESLREVAELEGLRAGDAVFYMRRGSPRDIDINADRRTPPPVFSRAPAAAVPHTPIGGVPRITPTPRAGVPRLGPPPIPGAAGDPRRSSTPFGGLPRLSAKQLHTTTDVFVLAGTPNAAAVITELTERLRNPGLEQLTIDLDAAELLGDELAPVLRRARAAAGAAGVVLVLRATRTGARRWLSRHGFEEDAP